MGAPWVGVRAHTTAQEVNKWRAFAIALQVAHAPADLEVPRIAHGLPER